MSVRLARHSDFSDIVTVLASAFRDESYVSSFLHPKADDYPERQYHEDLRRYWRCFLRPQWLDRKHVFMVALSDLDGHTIEGVANWKREVDNEPHAKWSIRVPAWLRTAYGRFINAIDSLMFPDRTLDHSRITAYQRAEPFFKRHFEGRGWSLETLGVSPDAQGNGHGSALVRAGLSKVDAEDSDAIVVCSEGTEVFYRQHGFTERVGNVTEGENNPLNEVRGGEILVRARHLKIEDHEDLK